MAELESGLHFRVMAFIYRLRDLLLPRLRILEEVGMGPGSHVLDYGCGPGSYILPLAKIVGLSGRIYALDIHSFAIQMVQRIISRRSLPNVETIHSDCKTGLRGDSIDVVLLYDVLHDLRNPDEVLEELHRVLQPGGVLSLRDHHLKEDQVLSKVRSGRLFELSRKGSRTYSFSKGGR